MNNRNDMEVTFEIMEHLGVLNHTADGWTKEANFISWNGGPSKLDIRDWDPDHERMTRGITLFETDAEALAKALTKYFKDPLDLSDFKPKKPEDEGEVYYEIVEHIAEIMRYENRETPWAKEVNIVSWNGGPAKVDIRDWNCTHNRMSRGVALDVESAKKLQELLAERFPDEVADDNICQFNKEKLAGWIAEHYQTICESEWYGNNFDGETMEDIEPELFIETYLIPLITSNISCDFNGAKFAV